MATVRTLVNHPYAQAKVIKSSAGSVLQSYKTNVAGIINGCAYCTGLYSRTTIKHISAYARENGLSYYMFKGIAGKDQFIDLTTGEIIGKDHERYITLMNGITGTWYRLI